MKGINLSVVRVRDRVDGALNNGCMLDSSKPILILRTRDSHTSLIASAGFWKYSQTLRRTRVRDCVRKLDKITSRVRRMIRGINTVC